MRAAVSLLYRAVLNWMAPVITSLLAATRSDRSNAVAGLGADNGKLRTPATVPDVPFSPIMRKG